MTHDQREGSDSPYAYSSDWVGALEKERRWLLYWQQQKLMDGLVEPDDTMLEIGVGNGFTSGYLRNRGHDVTTLDIDPGKNPDIVANIASYKFPQPYDVIMAFEVFEHLPFDDFERTMQRIRLAIRKYLFFSVPRNEMVPFRISLKVGARRRERSLEWRRLEGSIHQPYHHWELDQGETTTDWLERLVSTCGFTIVRHEKRGIHCFYALRPKEDVPSEKRDSSGASLQS